MKHIILHGPGTSPTLLVDDSKAEEIKLKFKSGEGFEVVVENCVTLIRKNTCWAMTIEDFEPEPKE